MRSSLIIVSTISLIAMPSLVFAQSTNGTAGAGMQPQISTPGQAPRPYEGRSVGGGNGKVGDVPSDREIERGNNSGSAHDSE